jgi:signal transduction histidine kinase
MLLSVVAVGVALVCMLLGLSVFLRNIHSSYHVWFGIFAGFLGLWIPANYFGSYQAAQSNLSVFFYGDFILAPLLAFSFCVYGIEAVEYYHVRRKKVSRLVLYAMGFLTAILSASAALHLVATPVYSADNVLSSKQVLYYPYEIVVAVFALVGLLSLLYASVRANKEYKQQTRFVLWGLTVAAIMLVGSNVIFPQLRAAQALSYFAILVMVVSLSYSIARHKLFDLRLIVARSVAYILLIISLAAIFAAVLLFLTTIFFQSESVGIGIKVAYISVALLLAFAFQPLKRFFDRITNSLFYRDAYDSQELLNELNRSLVTTIDLEEILNKSAQIIGSTLKTGTASLVVGDVNKHNLRMATSHTAHFDAQAVDKIATAADHISDKIIVSDELGSTKNALKELMQDAGITVFAKLHGRVQGRNQHPGFILLGPKKSGALYSSQDVSVLEIIADELVIAIQNALRFEEIQQFNLTLQKKIEDATKELRRTNAKLKALDEAKDEFISMASHQLRTPLTTIKGYLSMILDGDTGVVKKDQKDMIQHAFDSSQRMVYLIADLLNVSRMQTGKFAIENSPTNLAEVLVGEVDQLKNQAKAKDVELTYNKPASFPTLNLDENKIRQVLMNFLDNALHYTPNGGKIEAKLEATPDSVVYTVTDNGVGVPKDVQHHLFTKFYRADNARKMRPDGTGLGLFMAKKVIVSQGGALIFKSTEGQGSTFGFTFPRKGMEVAAGKPVKKVSAKA